MVRKMLEETVFVEEETIEMEVLEVKKDEDEDGVKMVWVDALGDIIEGEDETVVEAVALLEALEQEEVVGVDALVEL